MNLSKVETGAQLLARLGSRPSIQGIEDTLFIDGPNVKDVYELYGVEGSGKTELLLSIVTSIILPKDWNGYNLNGANAGVIFIDTDYKFQILRLVNIMEKRIMGKTEHDKLDTSKKTSSNDIEVLVKECLKKIMIVRCTSSFQLLVTLHSLESTISNNPDIAVIMIDSISAFYWIDRCNGGENIGAQETNMKHIVQQLSKLVKNYNLVLFATKALNFKKTNKENESKGDNCASPSEKKVLKDNHAEFLCKSWYKFVKHRLIFHKEKSFSVYCNSLKVDIQFTINEGGICFK
ncbi:DNA repair protein XRCC2-like isoform X2 [Mytilus galloprovincialis]|uniref:XRCC2 n=1 Tax=Mytilus edulis TaxID=6550 RepID=A0A8S3TYE5_MYTED|nr:XRCC2 [Mytilus edulis]